MIFLKVFMRGKNEKFETGNYIIAVKNLKKHLGYIEIIGGNTRLSLITTKF